MTQKTRFIQLRVTKDQYERIINNSRAKGYLNVSAYLRDLALEKDLVFQKKFNEIYGVIVKNKRDSATRHSSDYLE